MDAVYTRRDRGPKWTGDGWLRAAAGEGNKGAVQCFRALCTRRPVRRRGSGPCCEWPRRRRPRRTEGAKSVSPPVGARARARAVLASGALPGRTEGVWRRHVEGGLRTRDAPDQWQASSPNRVLAILSSCTRAADCCAWKGLAAASNAELNSCCFISPENRSALLQPACCIADSAEASCSHPRPSGGHGRVHAAVAPAARQTSSWAPSAG